jgi:glycosyltransferase involved in cell wall biosynthesis
MSNKYPNSKIDIILLSCNRKENTKETIDKLYERVLSPNKIRLIVVDNCSVDGTYKLLQEYKKKGKIDVLMSSPDDSTISEAYNLGFKSVKSDYFICMQDDVTIPMFKDKDVIERLQELLDKYPEQSGVGCRIQHIPNMKHNIIDEITPARKALSAYFRICRKDDFEKMGMLNPKKDWDDFNFVVRVREVLKKDCSWSNRLYCDHSRGHKLNRGYNVKSRRWGVSGTIHSRTSLIEYEPIDEITNVPLKIIDKIKRIGIKDWPGI